MRLRRRRREAPAPVAPEPVLVLPPLSSSPSIAKSLGVAYDPDATRPSTSVRPNGLPIAFHNYFDAGAPPIRSRSEHGHETQPSIAAYYSRQQSQYIPAATARNSVHSSHAPIRRPRQQAATLNVMAVGRRQTGKTSWLRTLLSTVELAPGAAKVETEERLARFSTDSGPTRAVTSISAEIVLQSGDRALLTVTDTPGLELAPRTTTMAEEVAGEFQITSILRHVEDRMRDSLSQESQVVRSTVKAADSFVHAVIYFIHPSSVGPSAPSGTLTPPASPDRLRKISWRSQSTPHLRTSPTEEVEGSGRGDDVEELCMSAFDLRAIRRLSERTTVIPVVARADELTVAQTEAVKAAIQRDLRRAGIGCGVLDTSMADGLGIAISPDMSAVVNGDAGAGVNGAADDRAESPKPIVLSRSRSRSHGRLRSHSLSRRRTLVEQIDDHSGPSAPDTAALLNVWPFALIAADRPGQTTTRKYRWATIEIDNPEHCDFGALKSMLLGSHLKSLREAAREHYASFRTDALLARQAQGSSQAIVRQVGPV